VIGGPVGSALQRPQQPVRQLGPPGKPGLIQLRAQIMMIEDEPGPVHRPQQHGDRPENVRRVARLEYPEPSRPPRLPGQPRRREEGIDVLGDEPGLAAAGHVRPVLVQLHALYHREPRITRPFGAHHRDPVTRRCQGLAFQPHPPVERHRKILHDDQNAAGQPGALRVARRLTGYSGDGWLKQFCERVFSQDRPRSCGSAGTGCRR
jgi:hypothetical protein